MERQKLFQYAVLWHPVKDQVKEGMESIVIIPITTIVAGDEKEVFMIAVRNIPDQYSKELKQCEVAIRPF